MASCWEPSLNLTNFHNVSSIKSAGECYQDPDLHYLYYYSVVCRNWFINQMNSLMSKIFMISHFFSHNHRELKIGFKKCMGPNNLRSIKEQNIIVYRCVLQQHKSSNGLWLRFLLRKLSTEHVLQSNLF
jgi:hypothetical protein